LILLGTIVNALAIILGVMLGMLIPNMNEKIQKTVLQGLSLAVIALGIQMTFSMDNPLIVILSIVIGGVIGELFKLEDRLNQVGGWIELKANQTFAKRNGNTASLSVARAFVTTTLVYCIGAMAVVGSMDSGLRNDHTVLYTKSLLDGFSAIIFTSTLGYGVVFSAVAVFIYQSILTISSSYIVAFISEGMVDQIIAAITGTGGLLIVAIGLNVMEVTKIRVANLLPSLIVASMMVVIYEYINPFLKAILG
jgi:uncharacterized membrane protein YqgA involved in biofilm formation